VEIGAFLGQLVVEIMEQAGQSPDLGILSETNRQRPHTGFDGQAMFDQVLVVQVVLDQGQGVFSGHGDFAPLIGAPVLAGAILGGSRKINVPSRASGS